MKALCGSKYSIIPEINNINLKKEQLVFSKVDLYR
jgi:hypothetical protein